jgi:hypothetical protein
LSGSTTYRERASFVNLVFKYASTIRIRAIFAQPLEKMITLVRAGTAESWPRMVAAVEEALRLGVSDTAAVLHIFQMPLHFDNAPPVLRYRPARNWL